MGTSSYALTNIRNKYAGLGIRKSGIDIIDNMRWGAHLCQFYENQMDLIETLVPFFKAGLENNEYCIWITAESLDRKKAVETLKSSIPDFYLYLTKGQIEILPYTEWYMRDGVFNQEKILASWLDKLEKALESGYEGLRASGDTIWLKNKTWQNFHEYESAVNNAIGDYKMLAICTYPIDKFSASELADVVATHQFALIRKNRKWEIIESAKYKQTKNKLTKKQEGVAELIKFLKKENIEKQNIANILQEALLTVPQQTNGIDFSCIYRSATISSGKVGGDFYDIFELEEDKIGITVGDISGKGVEAATIASLIKNTIKAYAHYEKLPSRVLSKTNKIIEKSTTRGTFATIFFGILDKKSQQLIYCNAGHPMPIIKRKTADLAFLKTNCPVIGIFDDIKYVNEKEYLNKDDILIIYTDGVVEARNGKNFFGENRLIRSIKSVREPNVSYLSEKIFDHVEKFTDGKFLDDIAILCISVTASI